MLKLTITKNNKNKKETNMSSLTIKLNKADHQVDVDTYINTLRSLSVIAKEVNYKINGSANLSINVVAEKPGSFECVVEFVNTYGPLIATIAPEIINITQVLIELYKLKKKASEIDFSKTQAIDDHSVQLCNNVGNGVMVVNNNTYNIFTGNQSVQDALSGTFSKIEKDQSVEGISFKDNEGDEVAFKREQFSSLAKKTTIQSQDSEYDVKPATLVVIKPVLDESQNKWTFLMNGFQIQADIKDLEFLAGVVNGEYRFGTGDRLMVELLIESEFHKKYKTFVPKKYSIVKVKSHITADEAEQMNLF